MILPKHTAMNVVYSSNMLHKTNLVQRKMLSQCANTRTRSRVLQRNTVAVPKQQSEKIGWKG